MKPVVLGVIAGLVLVSAAATVFAERSDAPLAPGAGVPAANASVVSSSQELIALSTSAGDHRQLVTLIDPQTRTMSVYTIDAATGEIVLKSVRNCRWDLQMMQYNGVRPLPQEIRAQFEPK
jgi:hypothetical protein